MARYNPHHDSAPVHAAARHWATLCLAGDGSVFVENEKLWTPSILAELDRLFVQNLDEGEGTFLEKLKGQLQTGSSASHKLMAEVLWILMLFQSNISPERKRETIGTVWAWSGAKLSEDHPMLADAVLGGLGSGGAGFNMYRWRELSFLLTLASAFKREDSNERKDLLSDAWRFSRWLAGVPQPGNRQFRHMVRHLLFPDEFERIASGREKRAILAAFSSTAAGEIKTWTDERIDRALLDLRRGLEAQAGTTELDFYSGELKTRWQKQAQPRTWLLSWNPDRWHWESLPNDRQSAATGNAVRQPWRCASGQVKEGDKVYLVRTGVPPQGKRHLTLRHTMTHRGRRQAKPLRLSMWSSPGFAMLSAMQ